MTVGSSITNDPILRFELAVGSYSWSAWALKFMNDRYSTNIHDVVFHVLCDLVDAIKHFFINGASRILLCNPTHLRPHVGMFWQPPGNAIMTVRRFRVRESEKRFTGIGGVILRIRNCRRKQNKDRNCQQRGED